MKIADDRQAISDRQTGRLALPLFLPLLDEEVDRDRHHRPDAGHHQGEQPPERRGDRNGISPCWARLAISLTGAGEEDGEAGWAGSRSVLRNSNVLRRQNQGPVQVREQPA